MRAVTLIRFTKYFQVILLRGKQREGGAFLKTLSSIKELRKLNCKQIKDTKSPLELSVESICILQFFNQNNQ